MNRIISILTLCTIVLVYAQCRTTRAKHDPSDASTEHSLPEKVQNIDSLAKDSVDVEVHQFPVKNMQM